MLDTSQVVVITDGEMKQTKVRSAWHGVTAVVAKAASTSSKPNSRIDGEGNTRKMYFKLACANFVVTVPSS